LVVRQEQIQELTIAPDESRYIEQLLEAYANHLKAAVANPGALKT
jgi:hypothetical protein